MQEQSERILWKTQETFRSVKNSGQSYRTSHQLATTTNYVKSFSYWGCWDEWGWYSAVL